MNNLLPSTDEVKCRVSGDLPLLLHTLLFQANPPRFDVERFMTAVVAERDRLLLRRLEGLVSVEDLQVAFTRQGDADIAPLAERIPSVYPIWMGVTSAAFERASAAVRVLNERESDS